MDRDKVVTTLIMMGFKFGPNNAINTRRSNKILKRVYHTVNRTIMHHGDLHVAVLLQNVMFVNNQTKYSKNMPCEKAIRLIAEDKMHKIMMLDKNNDEK